MERASSFLGGKIFASILPVLCGVLCALIANIPISFTGGILPPPLLALMPVYFWCLVRPDLMSPAWAFLIGGIEDVFSGGPPGIWAAAFVATYALIDRQRDAFAGLSGIGAMLGFATAALVAYVTAYALVSVLHGHLQAMAPVLGALAMTVLFYIPGAFLMGAIHRRIVGPSRSDF
jgi:rod shape-determining protein MreD